MTARRAKKAVAKKRCPDSPRLVYDPFLGSGTTLIAAENLDRVCYGIEISPPYIAVTLQRAKDYGMKPRLAKKTG